MGMATPTRRRAESEKTLQVVHKSSLRYIPKKTASRIDAELNAPQIRLSELGDVQKSPLELDLEIQGQRVLHVLEGAIESLEIMVSKIVIQSIANILLAALASTDDKKRKKIS